MGIKCFPKQQSCGAKTPRDSQLFFTSGFTGLTEAGGCTRPSDTREKLFSPPPGPNQHTCLGSLGLCLADSLVGKTGFCEGESRPRLPGVASKCKTSSRRSSSPEALPGGACPTQGPSLPSAPLPALLLSCTDAVCSPMSYLL